MWSLRQDCCGFEAGLDYIMCQASPGYRVRSYVPKLKQNRKKTSRNSKSGSYFDLDLTNTMFFRKVLKERKLSIYSFTQEMLEHLLVGHGHSWGSVL